MDKPMLVVGSKGSVVDELQMLLNKHGADLIVDGYFGPVTRKEVMQFQSNNGLMVDGVVGTQVWARLIPKTHTPIPAPVVDKNTQAIALLNQVIKLLGGN